MAEKTTATEPRAAKTTKSTAAKTIATKSAAKTTAATEGKPATVRKSTGVKQTAAAAARKTAARSAASRAAKTTAPAAVKTVVAKPVVKKTVSKRTTVRRARPTAEPAAAGGAPQTRRRTKVGMVVSAKSLQTVIVEVERLRQHPLYRKAVRVGRRYAAHTDTGDVLAGDLVRIQESRPYSATKRWRVIEVLSREGEAGAAAPRVADVEQALEVQEGVTDLLDTSKPAAAAPAATEEERS